MREFGQIRESGPKFVTTNLGPQIRDIPDLVGEIVIWDSLPCSPRLLAVLDVVVLPVTSTVASNLGETENDPQYCNCGVVQGATCKVREFLNSTNCLFSREFGCPGANSGTNQTLEDCLLPN